MKREELDVNKLVYATDVDTVLVDCEGTEVWPQDNNGCEYYFKNQADSVMDAMEKDNQDLRHNLEDWKVENEGLKQRIKELEEQCIKYQAELMNSDPALNDTPKWISVEDRLPEGNPVLPALCDDNKMIWWGCWHDCNLDLYGITHWMPLPSAPTTEEK